MNMNEFRVKFRTEHEDTVRVFAGGESIDPGNNEFLVVRDALKREVLRAPWINVLYVNTVNRV